MPKKKKKTKRQKILEALVHEKRHLTHRSESFLPLSLPPGFFFDAAELDLIVASTSGGCRWRHLDHIWNEEEELEDFSLSLSLSLLSVVAKGVLQVLR
jgi:hypothetical protein